MEENFTKESVWLSGRLFTNEELEDVKYFVRRFLQKFFKAKSGHPLDAQILKNMEDNPYQLRLVWDGETLKQAAS